MVAPDWLRGAVGFELTDLNVSFVLDTRGVAEDADSSTMTEKQKDLCRADAYTIYLSSSNKGTEKQQDGNSSLSKSGESFTYKDEITRMALFLYNRWGEEVPDILNNTVTDKSYMW